MNSINNFIPKENAHFYQSYQVNIFRMVPENAVLICVNKFTGEVFVKQKGFRINFPWIKSKLVNIAKTPIDYPKEKYLTKDGIYVEIDPALTVSIVDAKKVEFDNQNPVQELGILTKDVIRSFIANKNVTELIGKNFSLSEVDPAKLYEDFTRTSGLKVSQLYFKNVELPKSMIDDFEKAKAQELENKRAIQEAESKKRQAEINAEAEKIKANTQAYREKTILEAKVQTLQEKGLDKEISEILKTSILSSGNARVIATLNSDNNTKNAVDVASMLDALNETKEESNDPATTYEKILEEVKEERRRAVARVRRR